MNKSSKPLESQSPEGVQVHRGDGRSDDRPAPVPLTGVENLKRDGSARPSIMIASSVVDRGDLKDLHDIIEKNAERSEKQHDAMLSYSNNLNTENVQLRGEVETIKNRVLILGLVLLLLVGLTIFVLTLGFSFLQVP